MTDETMDNELADAKGRPEVDRNEIVIDLLGTVTFTIDAGAGLVKRAGLVVHPEPRYVRDERSGEEFDSWATTSYMPLPSGELGDAMRIAYESVRMHLNFIDEQGYGFAPESSTDPTIWPASEELEPVERCGCVEGCFWPCASDGDDSHDFVERCDECRRHGDDIEAAEYLGKLLGVDVKYAPCGASQQPHPYIDLVRDAHCVGRPRVGTQSLRRPS